MRANELRSLTRSSFKLDESPPLVTVKAGYTKNDEAAELPLRPETVAPLTEHLADRMPRARAFNMPTNNLNTVF